MDRFDRARPAPLPRARRDRRRSLVCAAARAHRGRLGRGARASRWTRGGPRRGAGRRQAGRLDRRPAAARRGSPTTPRRGSRPTRARRRAAARSRPPRAAPVATPRCRRSRRTPSIRPRSARKPAEARAEHAAGHGRLAVHAARHELGARAGADGVKVDARAAPRHRASPRASSSTGASCRPARSARQARRRRRLHRRQRGLPDEGGRRREIECCGADWAAEYANRVRRDDRTPTARRAPRASTG